MLLVVENLYVSLQVILTQLLICNYSSGVSVRGCKLRSFLLCHLHPDGFQLFSVACIITVDVQSSSQSPSQAGSFLLPFSSVSKISG